MLPTLTKIYDMCHEYKGANKLVNKLWGKLVCVKIVKNLYLSQSLICFTYTNLLFNFESHNLLE